MEVSRYFVFLLAAFVVLVALAIGFLLIWWRGDDG